MESTKLNSQDVCCHGNSMAALILKFLYICYLEHRKMFLQCLISDLYSVAWGA